MDEDEAYLVWICLQYLIAPVIYATMFRCCSDHSWITAVKSLCVQRILGLCPRLYPRTTGRKRRVNWLQSRLLGKAQDAAGWTKRCNAREAAAVMELRIDSKGPMSIFEDVSVVVSDVSDVRVVYMGR